MHVYSPSEAIGPAWEHTKALMWRDRRWGRLLKLSLVAVGAELGTSFNFNLRGMGNSGSPQIPASLLWGLASAALLFGALLFVALLYLGSRLQLAQFDILVLRDPMVAPAWERHGSHTWRWAGIKVAILLGVLLVLLPLLIPALPIFVAFVRSLQPVAGEPGHLPTFHWGALFVLFAELLVVVMVALMLIRCVTSLVLPGVALEDLRFADAFVRGWQIFRADVPGMLWFAVLQPVFVLLLGLAVVIAMLLLVAVLALPCVLAGYLLLHALHPAGAMAYFLLGTLGVLAAVIVGAIAVCVYLVLSGTLLMFARAWSLYFLGGRYPLLGQYLQPSPAVPVWTPPPSLPRDEDDGGPGFPADPALA